MRWYSYWLTALFLSFPWLGEAQTTEFPYATVGMGDLKEFKPGGGNWKIAGDVFYDFHKGGNARITPGTGILVNDLSGKSKDHLFTNMEHGDIDLELEFMMDKGSNAGVYLQGRYEIQMFDSWGVYPPKTSDCGAIYERWDERRPEGRQGYEGHPPAQNVSRAPGLWQHFRIEFRAPRFDANGNKIENARFIKVVHNGVVIHENVEVTGPTRAAAFDDEKPFGPLMIQGDHGPVAVRNIKYKAYGPEQVTLANLQLTAYEGRFSSVTEVVAAPPVAEVSINALKHEGTDTDQYYGGKINGTIHIPKSGPYYFHLNLKWIPEDTNPDNPNGGGELKIGDKTLVFLDGKETGMGSTTVTLEAGVHSISLVYFKKYGHWYQPANDIVLGTEAPGIAYTNLNEALHFAEAVGAITVPVSGEPVMVRSFVNHHGEKKTHAISVGEPGSAHYSYDLASGSVLQHWRGDFLETTHMWHGRGEPQLGEPLGSVISRSGKPTVALLRDRQAAWPDSNANYNYLGYDVTTTGHPVFKYTIGSTEVRESLEADDAGNRLSHTITVVSSGEDEVWCLVADGSKITRQPNGTYAVNDKQYFLQLPPRAEPLIRTGVGGEVELLLQIKAKNKNASIKYSIIR